MEEISQSEIPFVPASLKSRYLQVSSSVLWVSLSAQWDPSGIKTILQSPTSAPEAPLLLQWEEMPQ